MATASWVKQIFTGTDKVFDILNVGRLIFYTAGGLLAVYPLFITGNMLTATTADRAGGFYSTLSAASDTSAWFLFFAALVAGFVLANVAFTQIVTPTFQRIVARISVPIPNPLSFNYQYPFLKDESDEDQDYQAWLVSEYFRYVEISVIVPLGLFVGICLLAAHALVYLLTTPFSTGTGQAVAFLNVTAAAAALLKYHVWPRFWRPGVVEPTVRTYLRAKVNLVRGVEDLRRRGAASKT